MKAEPGRAVSIAALTVVYDTPPSSLARTIEAFDNSVRLGRAEGLCSRFVLALGDASARPVLGGEDVDRLQASAPGLELVYEYFDENTGTSKGQNALSRMTDSDLVLICNPDVIPDGRALWQMAAVFDDPGVGMVEAKQLPVEHPKDYDPETGLTSWGSGAFSLVPRLVFEVVDGFDEQTFFLYCDDVDLSWRIREAGYDIVMLPSAVVYHDKQLSTTGQWVPTEAERHFSAQAALLLAHKWSRDDVVEQLEADFERSDVPELRAALREFERRRERGELAPQRDPEHRVGTFVDGTYEVHRYVL